MSTAATLLRRRVAATVSPSAAGPAWAALSEHFSELAEARSPRDDLNVICAPEAAMGHPGYYMPSTARIALDGSILPETPERLNLDDREHFAALAALQGVFVHELGHAVHTDSMRAALEGDHAQTATLLEEIRMEARAIDDRGKDAQWIRAAARKLILEGEAGQAQPQTRQQAARVAVLTEGRVAAGSLQSEDVSEVSRVLEQIFEADDLAELRSILHSAAAVADGDIAGMEDAARRFRALLGEDPDQPEGGQGAGRELSEDEAKALGEALDEAAKAAAEASAGELEHDAEGSQLDEALASVMGDPEVGEIDREAEDASPDTVGHGCAPEGSVGVRYSERPPNAAERIQRSRLAQVLRRARWRDRDLVRVASDVPPGRVRMREAMRGSAERSMGRMSSAKPWRKTKRRSVEQPRLSVAVLIDVSGSMGPYVADLASSLWTIAGAVSDTQGTALGVGFGDEARVVVDAGRPPKNVMMFPADGGFERIGSALQLADQELQLGNPGRARLVVIVSDGHWVAQSEAQLADLEIQRLQQTGVKVIQVGLGSPPVEHGCDRAVALEQASDLAELVGGACVEALR